MAYGVQKYQITLKQPNINFLGRLSSQILNKIVDLMTNFFSQI